MQHINFFLPHSLYQEVIKVVQPVLLGSWIEYFERSDPIDTAALHEAYMCAAGISLSAMILAVFIISISTMSTEQA